MAEYTWKDYARALALAESLVDVASEEPPPSDAALRDEVCMARAVVAADIIIRRLQADLLNECKKAVRYGVALERIAEIDRRCGHETSLAAEALQGDKNAK